MNDVTDMTSQVDESDINADEGEDEGATPDELTLLKERARSMGLQISPKIGLETLRKKISDHLNDVPPTPEGATTDPVAPAVNRSPGYLKAQRRKKLIEENMRLIRIRVTNLNPDKLDIPGEFFTFSNKYLGVVTKYVPFGEMTDEGYHVPVCIYEMMKERRFLQKKSKVDPKNPANVTLETRWVNEFAMEVLPQLTETELKRLALQQAAAAGTAE